MKSIEISNLGPDSIVEMTYIQGPVQCRGIRKLRAEGDGLQVSDGYHTMDELYDHRRALNIALFNTLNELYGRSGMYMFVPKVFKAKNHHPDCDSMFEGYFVVFAVGRDGQWTSYHYELKYWDHFKIRETEHSLNYPINHEDAIEFFSNLHWKV